MTNTFSISFFAVVILVCITLYFFHSSSKWRKVRGVIKSISIKEIYRNPNTAFAEIRSLYDYKVEVDYTYTIGNKTYNGNKLIAGLPNIFSEKAIAEQYVTKYPEGQEVSIYYNPKNPNQSALETAKSLGGVKNGFNSGAILYYNCSFCGSWFLFDGKVLSDLNTLNNLLHVINLK